MKQPGTVSGPAAIQPVSMLTGLSALLSSAPIRAQAHRVTTVDGERRVEVIRVWPGPACFRYTTESGWRPCRLDLHIRCADKTCQEATLDDLGWDEPLGPLFTAVPTSVREVLRPQDVDVCWAALRLLEDVPERLDVLRDSPTLGGWLAVHVDDAADRAAACSELRKLSTRRRRVMLSLIGLPARKCNVRLLGRLDPWALSVPGPPYLADLINDRSPQVRKWLRHLPTIRADVAIVLREPVLRALTTFELLADEGDAIGFGLHLALVEIIQARLQGNALATPKRFRSRLEVLDFCDALPPQSSFWNLGDFPEPFESPTSGAALPGAPYVLLSPVCTAAEMQGHTVPSGLCLSTQRRYAERAKRGDGALYFADWTEGARRHRAAVWLGFSMSRGWWVEESALSHNRPVPDWLVARLDPWAASIEHGLAEQLDETLEFPTSPLQLLLPFQLRHSAFDIPSADDPGGAFDRSDRLRTSPDRCGWWAQVVAEEESERGTHRAGSGSTVLWPMPPRRHAND